MKFIPLGGKYGKGKVAIVDDRNYERLAKHNWTYVPPDPAVSRYSEYASRKIKLANGKWSRIGMHRAVMNAPTGTEVDHHDHNGLDNRERNLRIVSSSQNCLNRRKKRGSSSLYKGVHRRKDGTGFQASITYLGRLRWIGYFDNELQAAMAYDMWATALHGEFALLNFQPVGGLNGYKPAVPLASPADGDVVARD